MRIILAILAGIVVAVAGIFIVWLIAHAVYPLPAEVDIGNLESVGPLISAMPLGAQAFVVAAWFAGALVGGFTAVLIARRRRAAWAVGAAVALASILNVLMIPHPEWMQVSAVIAPALGALLAGHFGVRAQAASALRPDDA